MMELIRISPNDLDDLRNLLMYFKENDIDVDDVNKLVMFLGKKYDFDPFKCAINILTGIVSERKRQFSLYDQPIESPKKAPKEPKSEPLPSEVEEKDPSLKIIEDENIEVIEKSKGMKTIRINSKKSKTVRKKDTKDYIPELKKWIRSNGLDLLKVRKLVSDLEYTKRMKEITPGLVAEDSEYLYEFQDWVESRELSYLNIRMMLAILAQEEENRKREAVIAR